MQPCITVDCLQIAQDDPRAAKGRIGLLTAEVSMPIPSLTPLTNFQVESKPSNDVTPLEEFHTCHIPQDLRTAQPAKFLDCTARNRPSLRCGKLENSQSDFSRQTPPMKLASAAQLFPWQQGCEVHEAPFGKPWGNHWEISLGKWWVNGI